MADHVHISAMTALIFALHLIIVSFFLRMIQMTWPESSLGKALAVIL